MVSTGMNTDGRGIPTFLTLMCARYKLAETTQLDRTRVSVTKRPLCEEERCLARISFVRKVNAGELPASSNQSTWMVSSICAEHISVACLTFDSRVQSAPPLKMPADEAEQTMAALLLERQVPPKKAAFCLNALGGTRYTPQQVASFLGQQKGPVGHDDDIAKLLADIEECTSTGGFADVILTDEEPPGAGRPAEYQRPGPGDGGEVRAIIWATRAQLVYARAFGYLIVADTQSIVAR